MDSIDTEVSAALDALAIAVSNARESRAADGWISAMALAYSDSFAAISKRAGTNMATALVRSGIYKRSPAALAAARTAGELSMSDAVASFYEILAGSMVVSAQLLERLAAATNTDPDEILRSIATGGD